MKIVSNNGTYRAVKVRAAERAGVLLLCSDDPHHKYLLAALHERFHLVGVIVEPSRLQQAGLWKGRKYVDWLYRYYHIKRQKLTGRSKYRARYFDAITLRGEDKQVEITEVDRINSPQALAKVRELQPDVTIVCGTKFIGRKMIDASGLIINIHGGYLPDYKGNHGIFFAYYNYDFEKIGATLHLVTLQLDGGDIIEVVKPPIFPHDNDEHLYCRAVHLAMLRLFEILEDFERACQPIVCQKQQDVGRTYRHRSRKVYYDILLWLRRRLGLQKVPHIPALTRKSYLELPRK